MIKFKRLSDGKMTLKYFYLQTFRIKFRLKLEQVSWRLSKNKNVRNMCIVFRRVIMYPDVKTTNFKYFQRFGSGKKTSVIPNMARPCFFRAIDRY